jgi:hypothetical protein
MWSFIIPLSKPARTTAFSLFRKMLTISLQQTLADGRVHRVLNDACSLARIRHISDGGGFAKQRIGLR